MLTCALDGKVMAWTEPKMSAHCDDLEVIAQKQKALAASTMSFLECILATNDLCAGV